MLRAPSFNPERDRRLAELEALLAKLEAVPADERSADYLPWKEEYLVERIAELKKGAPLR